MDGSAEGGFSIRAICKENLQRGFGSLQTLSAIAFVLRASLVDANSPHTRRGLPRATAARFTASMGRPLVSLRACCSLLTGNPQLHRPLGLGLLLSRAPLS
jgi:hypothetical protein